MAPVQVSKGQITLLSVDMNAYTGSFNTVYINGNLTGGVVVVTLLIRMETEFEMLHSLYSRFNKCLFTLDGWTHQESFSVVHHVPLQGVYQ